MSSYVTYTFTQDQWKALSRYIYAYIEEELSRGNEIDYFTIEDAMEAFLGGAGDYMS